MLSRARFRAFLFKAKAEHIVLSSSNSSGITRRLARGMCVGASRAWACAHHSRRSTISTFLRRCPPGAARRRIRDTSDTGTFHRGAGSLCRRVARFDRETQRDANDMSEPGIPEGARRDYQRTRAQILNRLAAAIENQAPIQGDALRALAVRTLAASDLGTVAQALDAASATLTNSEQCAWSLSYIGLLLSRISEGIAVQREINDMDDAMGRRFRGPSLDVLEGRIAELNDRFERTPNAVLAALKRVRMPNVLRTRDGTGHFERTHRTRRGALQLVGPSN